MGRQDTAFAARQRNSVSDYLARALAARCATVKLRKVPRPKFRASPPHPNRNQGTDSAVQSATPRNRRGGMIRPFRVASQDGHASRHGAGRKVSLNGIRGQTLHARSDPEFAQFLAQFLPPVVALRSGTRGFLFNLYVSF